MEPGRGAQDVGPAAVGVDRRVVRWRQGTGASTYAQGLRQGVRDAGFTLVALTDASSPDNAAPGRLQRWTAALSPFTAAARSCPEGLLAPDAFRRAQVHFDIYGRFLRLRAASPPALMHWSYPLPLRLAGAPNLYCVHDLIPILHPDLTAISQRRSRRMLARLRHEAAHLVTVSETSRREIITTLGWPEDRVTNTYEAVEPPGWSAAEARAVTIATTESVGVAVGDYFIHVGTVEPRKNIGRLIEAYRESGSRRALVLVGPDGWQSGVELAGARDLLHALGSAVSCATGHPRIVRVGWMPQEALLGLIHGAAALLAPSLAEGFGLPAIEAMACGTPALTSDTGAPAEVAGEAAMRVDPRDVRALANAIRALDTDAGLRGRLSDAGRVRVRMFSAQAYAARLAALYGAVLARDASRS